MDASPMKTSDFSYDLPQELIAQTPIEPRDSSKLVTGTFMILQIYYSLGTALY